MSDHERVARKVKCIEEALPTEMNEGMEVSVDKDEPVNYCLLSSDLTSERVLGFKQASTFPWVSQGQCAAAKECASA